MPQPVESDDRAAATVSSKDGRAAQDGPVIETVLTGLANPRGVVVLPDGSLMVAEAGSGYNAVDPQELSGRLTHFQDTTAMATSAMTANASSGFAICPPTTLSSTTTRDGMRSAGRATCCATPMATSI